MDLTKHSPDMFCQVPNSRTFIWGSYILGWVAFEERLSIEVAFSSRWWTCRCSWTMWHLTWTNMRRTCMTFSTTPGTIKHMHRMVYPGVIQAIRFHVNAMKTILTGTTKIGLVSAFLLWMADSILSPWRLTRLPPASTPPSTMSRACTGTSMWRAPHARIAWADTQKIYR